MSPTEASDDLLQQIVDLGCRLLNARYGALGVLDEKTGAIAKFIVSGVDEETRRAIGEPPEGKGILGVLTREARPIRLKEIEKDARSAGFPPGHPPMRSFLGVPLASRGKVLGNFYFAEKRGADEFTEQDESYALLFASLAVKTIESDRHRQEALVQVGRLEAAQEGLRRLNRTVRVLSACNQAVVRAGAEAELLGEVCRILVEMGGYRFAWVGFAEQDEAKSVRAAAQAGFEEGYLDTIRITWADTERGRGPTGTAIRTGAPCVLRDVLTDPQYESWRAEAAKRGFRSSIALPLLDEGRAFGALNIYAGEPDAFDAEELALLEELAGDLSYGILASRTRVERNRAEEALQKTTQSLQALVQASPLAIFSLDRQGNVLFWNAAAERMFGWSAEEVIGRPLPYVPEEKKAEFQSNLRAVFQGADLKGQVLVRQRKDGAPIPIRGYSGAVRDEEGGIVSVMGVCEDITEHVRAEERRERYIERLRITGEIAKATSSTLKPQEVFQTVIREIRRAVPCERCHVAEVDHETKEYHYLYVESDIDVRAQTGEERADAGAWFYQEVYEKKKPKNIYDLREIRRPWAHRMTEAGFRGQLVIPIQQGEQCIGHLTLVSTRSGAFSEDHEKLLAAIADHLASAIRNAGLYEEASRSRDFLRSLVDDNADAITVVGADGKIVLWNAAAERLHGYTEAEALGRTPEFILPESMLHQKERQISKVLAGQTVQFDTYRLRKDGTRVPVSISISPVRDFEGRVIARTAIHRDLTEQKRAEEEREKYVERLKVLNLFSQKIVRSLDLNEVLEFVVHSAAELVGVPFVGVFTLAGETLELRAAHGGFRLEPGQREFHLGEGAAGWTAQRGEICYIEDVTKDSRWKYTEWADRAGVGSFLGVPLRSGDRVLGVLTCLSRGIRRFTDEEVDLITVFASGAAIAIENAETHSRLEASYEELRRSQEIMFRTERLSSLGTLAAGAAHEILNPATIIAMRAQRLAGWAEEGSREKESAELVLQNVQRIVTICEDLRRFSRDEAPVMAPFDPNEAIRETLPLLGRELRLQDIDVELNLAEDVPAIRGDKNQIQQVFLNFILNARDAMPRGGKLTLTSREILEDGRKWWEVRVADTGEGIPKEILHRIFDPFFTTKSKDKGTGLGLSVSHGIIERHGGSLEAESLPGKGATFIVRLPIAEGEG